MTTLRSATRKARRSDATRWGARAGLLARGLLWLVIGLLAARVALGGHDRADKKGALQALKDQPLGEVLLVVLALAFAAHAVFRLLEAATVDGRWHKAWQVLRAVVYGFLAASTARFLVSSGSSDDASKPTARAMGWPLGRELVGAVGLGIVVAGIVMAVRGFRQDFSDDLVLPRGTAGTVLERVGTAGLAGRGLVYALVGFFVVQAAVTFDPKDAKGLDASLKTLARQPFGAVLLWFAVLCLLSFAAFSFVEARYRRV